MEKIPTEKEKSLWKVMGGGWPSNRKAFLTSEGRQRLLNEDIDGNMFWKFSCADDL